MKEVYILMVDGDGTLRSVPEPFGVAVTTEEEAKRYVKEGKGYGHAYSKVVIFEDKDEAIKYAFRDVGNWYDADLPSKSRSTPRLPITDCIIL